MSAPFPKRLNTLPLPLIQNLSVGPSNATFQPCPIFMRQLHPILLSHLFGCIASCCSRNCTVAIGQGVCAGHLLQQRQGPGPGLRAGTGRAPWTRGPSGGRAGAGGGRALPPARKAAFVRQSCIPSIPVTAPFPQPSPRYWHVPVATVTGRGRLGHRSGGEVRQSPRPSTSSSNQPSQFSTVSTATLHAAPGKASYGKPQPSANSFLSGK